ncbi:GIY-YIG nuclease family protein [Paracoccus sp. R86501]|uniref:GIY-YIG nuclease family protein n=1 Tax=Paracoccus sp. R86501 TaxID=3101711 RepID=UPI00366F7386
MLASPRTRLDAAIKREELNRTGVYLLHGDSHEGDLPSVYVGEGDSIMSRLKAHATDPDKDFWDRFVAITSKDMNLTKAHVRYLEGKLIGLLQAARKCRVVNRTQPEFERLPEADIADMDSFLDEIQLILPVIGIDVLRRPATAAPLPPVPEVQAVTFRIDHPAKGIAATATEVDGEFVVLSGSTGSLQVSPSFSDKARMTRDQAKESGRIVVSGSRNFTLREDMAFGSPSAASVFLFGTSRNGRTDWLVSDGLETYAAFKARQLN